MITKRVHDNESYMGPSDPFKRSQSCIVQNNPVEAISNTIRSPKAYFLPMKCDMSVFFFVNRVLVVAMKPLFSFCRF